MTIIAFVFNSAIFQVIINGEVYSSNMVEAAAGPHHHLVCGECNAAFQDGDVLFQHWLEEHCRPNHQQHGRPPHQQDRLELEHCATCNHVFVKGTDRLSEHVATCSAAKRKEAPEEDDESASSGSSVKAAAAAAKNAKKPSGAASSSSVVSCGICSVDVKTVTSFFLHWLDAHHQIMEVLQEVWQCGQCRPNKLFPSATRLSDHVRERHPYSRNVYQCSADPEECRARYASVAEAEEHQRRVHQDVADAAARCPACKKQVQELAPHFRREHERTCELCGCQLS